MLGELIASINAHLIWGIEEDGTQRQEDTGVGESSEVLVTLNEVTPQANASDLGEVSGGLVDMIGERLLAEVESDVDTRLALLDESLNIGDELSGVGSSKVDDDSTGSWYVFDDIGSSRLYNAEFIRTLV